MLSRFSACASMFSVSMVASVSFVGLPRKSFVLGCSHLISCMRVVFLAALAPGMLGRFGSGCYFSHVWLSLQFSHLRSVAMRHLLHTLSTGWWVFSAAYRLIYLFSSCAFGIVLPHAQFVALFRCESFFPHIFLHIRL